MHNRGVSLRLLVLLVAGLGVILVTQVGALCGPFEGARLAETSDTSLLEPTTITDVAGDSIVIDHTQVDAGVIPMEWLDQARALDTFFGHRSVGNNILDGMGDLMGMDAQRYTIAIDGSGPSWFESHSGIGHTSIGSNQHPQTKIDHFDRLIRLDGYDNADLAMMKFCPSDSLPFGDMPGDEIWIAYRDMMAALETDYPELAIVWWTFPLATAADNRGNDQRAVFNNSVRQYCAAHECVLFDIADIESHDPSGNPVTSITGHESMWNGYSYDGGHLNEVGRQRVANAYWSLLARSAGWNGNGGQEWLTVTPLTTAKTVQPGGSAAFPLALTASPGFDDPVNLAVTNPPPATTVSFNPNPLTPPGESTLTLATSSQTPAGTYTLEVQAQSGALSDAASVILTVQPMGTFAIAADPSWQQVSPGGAIDYEISLTSQNGFAAPVSLSVAGLPSNASAGWQTNPVTPPGSTRLRISTAGGVPPGTYDLVVSGNGGGLTASAVISMTVNSSTTGFTLHVDPEQAYAQRNESVTYQVTAERNPGFTGAIDLSTAHLPEIIQASWTGNPLLPDQQATLTLYIPINSPCGVIQFGIVGTSGSVIRSVEAVVRVVARHHIPVIFD